MKINTFENEVNILIENTDNIDINDFINYINTYNNKIIVSQDNEKLQINFNDIILFYSDKKNNYCRTKKGDYKIKNKLYEIENYSKYLIRISKSCIVNINHVLSFDMGETGKIIIKLDDNTNEIVSRRKIKDVMRFLDERGIYILGYLVFNSFIYITQLIIYMSLGIELKLIDSFTYLLKNNWICFAIIYICGLISYFMYNFILIKTLNKKLSKIKKVGENNEK